MARNLCVAYAVGTVTAFCACAQEFARRDGAARFAAEPNLAALAFQAGDFEATASHAEAALSAPHPPAAAHVAAAAVALQQGDAAAARRHCQAALQREPDSYEALYNLG